MLCDKFPPTTCGLGFDIEAVYALHYVETITVSGISRYENEEYDCCDCGIFRR